MIRQTFQSEVEAAVHECMPVALTTVLGLVATTLQPASKEAEDPYSRIARATEEVRKKCPLKTKQYVHLSPQAIEGLLGYLIEYCLRRVEEEVENVAKIDWEAEEQAFIKEQIATLPGVHQ